MHEELKNSLNSRNVFYHPIHNLLLKYTDIYFWPLHLGVELGFSHQRRNISRRGGEGGGLNVIHSACSYNQCIIYHIHSVIHH